MARNGPEFEARIRQNELGNPKFNFLNSGDPYHAYYQHKVKEIREGKGKYEMFFFTLLSEIKFNLASAVTWRVILTALITFCDLKLFSI